MTEKELFENGSILQAYSQNTLLSVNPCFEIGKVRFSVVKLNTGGKECIDIYLDCEEVRILAEEIDKGIAGKKIAEDTRSDYPEAYQFVKGKDGQKKLKIGKGKKGVIVQASDTKDGKNAYLMAPITMNDLKTLAFNYELVSGLIPVTENSFYDKLIKVFIANEGKRVADREAYANKDNTEQKAKKEEKAPLEIKSGVFKIKSKATPKESGNGINYIVSGCMDSNTEEKTMIFYFNQIKDVQDKFNRLLKMLNEKEEGKVLSVPILYSEKDGYIFRGFKEAA